MVASKKKHSVNKYSAEKFKKIYEKEDSFILSLLKGREKIKTSPHGFYYEILDTVSTSDMSFEAGDEMYLSVSVFTLKDHLVYEERELSFFLDRSSEVIRGINEGVKLMKVGQIFRFYFTSFQAYGIWGDRKKISPNMPLIYKVKLLSVRRAMVR